MEPAAVNSVHASLCRDSSAWRTAICRRCSSRPFCWPDRFRSACSRVSPRTLLAIASRDALRTGAGTARVWQDSASGQRLHHGYQRRYPDSLARILAVRALQRDCDHVEVCHPLEGTPSVESHRTLRSARCCCWRRKFVSTLSVQWGNDHLAHADCVGARSHDHLAG